ncbi:hypothetical protein V5N11_013776 [Cardamine amara subsp. amara]|uniref:Integrase zinc-binding domain-containing protein n=1 Tax=Cardamine amara subsp. amara TaxID=228776 RepID=A0ABD1BVY9_CARAN
MHLERAIRSHEREIPGDPRINRTPWKKIHRKPEQMWEIPRHLKNKYSRDLIGESPLCNTLRRVWYLLISGMLENLSELSSKYCIIDSKLYKRSISGPYLVCVHGLDMLKVMAELHEGSCGSHSGGRASAIRIKKQGYFWPKIVADCETYSTKCDKCQRHAPLIHQPAELMSFISAPYPFMRWCMDIKGRRVPSGDNELCFVLVLTNYFTKWIEAEAYSQITKEQVEITVHNSYQSHFDNFVNRETFDSPPPPLGTRRGMAKLKLPIRP